MSSPSNDNDRATSIGDGKEHPRANEALGNSPGFSGDAPESMFISTSYNSLDGSDKYDYYSNEPLRKETRSSQAQAHNSNYPYYTTSSDYYSRYNQSYPSCHSSPHPQTRTDSYERNHPQERNYPHATHHPEAHRQAQEAAPEIKKEPNACPLPLFPAFPDPILNNYGILPSRTTAFIPPCDLGPTLNIYSSDDDDDEDVAFEFDTRNDCATQFSVTIEPKKQEPYWKTLLRCGFKPMIQCQAPHGYLQHNSETAPCSVQRKDQEHKLNEFFHLMMAQNYYNQYYQTAYLTNALLSKSRLMMMPMTIMQTLQLLMGGSQSPLHFRENSRRRDKRGRSSSASSSYSYTSSYSYSSSDSSYSDYYSDEENSEHPEFFRSDTSKGETTKASASSKPTMTVTGGKTAEESEMNTQESQNQVHRYKSQLLKDFASSYTSFTTDSSSR